jgi:hypothetical protein
MKVLMMCRMLLLWLTILLGLVSCAIDRTIARQESPDKTKEVIVYQINGGPDSTIRVKMKTASGVELVLKDNEERTGVREARIEWSKDSRFFVVRVFCGSGDLIFPYDTSSHRWIQLSLVKAALANEHDLIRLIEIPDGWGPTVLR